MSALFGLFGENKRKQKPAKQVQVKGELFDEDYIHYCTHQDRTLKQLEANLHTSDDPEEIAMGTLKTACDFYEGDWVGILEVDLDLGIWTPVWWYNPGGNDRTRQLMHEFEAAEFMPSWIQAMNENNAIIVPDAAAVKDLRPDEYGVYQRLRVNSVIAAPFKPNPVGFLAIRNPKRYIDQPGMLIYLAYVLHRAMSQKKTMDSAKMKISPENIDRDTDVIIHLLGNLEVYTSKGVIREADFKSPMMCKMLAYLALHPKTMTPPWKMVSVLWPEDSDDADNLSKNVKYLLYRFRQVFSLISDYQLIESSVSGYRLNPELNVMTDLQMFDHYRNSIQGTPSLAHKVELLKKAVSIYEGHVFDSGNSEDWVMPTATHYALEYVGVINELLKIMAEAKDYSDVIKYAAQSLEIEPGNMRAHYWRIFALYQSGASEMARASLPMAKRSLTEEEYADLIELLRQMQRKYPPEKGHYGEFLP